MAKNEIKIKLDQKIQDLLLTKAESNCHDCKCIHAKAGYFECSLQKIFIKDGICQQKKYKEI